MGLIASIGLNQSFMFSNRPSVGILATGNELVRPGTRFGKMEEYLKATKLSYTELVKQYGRKNP